MHARPCDTEWLHACLQLVQQHMARRLLACSCMRLLLLLRRLLVCTSCLAAWTASTHSRWLGHAAKHMLAARVAVSVPCVRTARPRLEHVYAWLWQRARPPLASPHALPEPSTHMRQTRRRSSRTWHSRGGRGRAVELAAGYRQEATLDERLEDALMATPGAVEAAGSWGGSPGRRSERRALGAGRAGGRPRPMPASWAPCCAPRTAEQALSHLL